MKEVQNTALPDADVVDGNKLHHTPDLQRPPPTVQPQQGFVPPPMLPQQVLFPQVRPRMPHVNFTPRYQPLSPPLSPENQIFTRTPIHQPLPMSNNLSARPRTDILQPPSLPYQHHLRGPLPPNSPPNPHLSPIRGPGSPLVEAHASNPFRINHQQIIGDVRPGMVPIPLTPPQGGPLPIAQLFGSPGNPGNPFQLNFFPRVNNMFINTSPELSPHSPQHGPGYAPLTHMPVIGHDIPNQSPRVFSCEELEKGDDHVPSPQRGPNDGVQRKLTDEVGSLGVNENVLNTENASPSVLDGLRSLKIAEQHFSTERPEQNQAIPLIHQETSCTTDGMKVTSTGIGHSEMQDFKPPPSVQNVAAAVRIKFIFNNVT